MSAQVFLSLLSVIFFCTCSFFLLKTFLAPVPVFNNTNYSKRALRIAKSYKVIAWAIMTLVFFLSLVISFVEVLTQL